MNIFRLAISIAICQAAGIIGAIFTAQSVQTWYAALEKPSFSPPNWLFGPVWITLYTMMGVALYLVWQKSGHMHDSKPVFIVFSGQLVLNALWSFVFFGLRSPFLGLLEITALWGMIMLTILLFWRVSVPAGVLLIPYALWVTFAVVLNFSIWRLNSSP